MHLPDMPGLDVLRRLRELDARSPVIFITGHGTTDTAIEAMKLGAYEYLLKPLELSTLRQVVERALAISRLMHVPAVLAAADDVDERADAIVGVLSGHAGGVQGHRPRRRPGRDRAHHRRERHRQGTGRPRHSISTAAAPTGRSCRSTAPPSRSICWRASCSATRRARSPGPTAGASASSSSATAARCSSTRSGDDVPLTQSKMLRVLQEQSFERLGGNETIRTDVRVLAATNLRPGAGRRRRAVSPRPVLSAQRLHHPSAAAARARRRSATADRATICVASTASWARTCKAWRRRRWRCCAAIRGRATCASCKACSSRRCCRRPGPVLLPDFLPASVEPAHRRQPRRGDAADEAGLEAFIESRLQAGTEDLYAEGCGRLERLLVTRVLRHTGGNQLQAAKILGITRGSAADQDPRSRHPHRSHRQRRRSSEPEA